MSLYKHTLEVPIIFSFLHAICRLHLIVLASKVFRNRFNEDMLIAVIWHQIRPVFPSQGTAEYL
jgi:hypothetical protein